MARESKLFQQPTALNTRKSFGDVSFSLPDGEKGLFCSLMLSKHMSGALTPSLLHDPVSLFQVQTKVRHTLCTDIWIN